MSGRLIRNPANLVKPPARVRRELVPLSANQVRILMAATADDRLGPLYTSRSGPDSDRASFWGCAGRM